MFIIFFIILQFIFVYSNINDIEPIIKFQETYENYINFIKKYDSKKDRWIYDIIDGYKEQDKIIFKNDILIVIPSITWNNNINKLHILAISTDKSIRCLRELNSSHIQLLEYVKKQTLAIILYKYNLTENNLKIFFHYDPSTYHIHIHFMNLKFRTMKSSVEYSHDINNVIFNLEIDTDYYKKINLNINRRQII